MYIYLSIYIYKSTLQYQKLKNMIWRTHKFSTRIITKIPHLIVEHASTIKFSCEKLFLVSGACIFSSRVCAMIARRLAAPDYIWTSLQFFTQKVAQGSVPVQHMQYLLTCWILQSQQLKRFFDSDMTRRLLLNFPFWLYLQGYVHHCNFIFIFIYSEVRSSCLR